MPSAPIIAFALTRCLEKAKSQGEVWDVLADVGVGQNYYYESGQYYFVDADVDNQVDSVVEETAVPEQPKLKRYYNE